MDSMINKLTHKTEGTQQQPAAGAGADKPDYVDKAAEFGFKKSGHNVDRNTQEKITDAGRGIYEKVTGKKVDPKISN